MKIRTSRSCLSHLLSHSCRSFAGLVTRAGAPQQGDGGRREEESRHVETELAIDPDVAEGIFVSKID